MADNQSLTVRTPAKLILSGEHAVVYGYPALAVAINHYTTTTVRWTTPLHFSFHLHGIDFRKKLTLEALKRLKRKLNKQYAKFNAGSIHISDVLKHPFELTLFTVINVLEKIKHKLPMGIDIATDSSIPIGCGLGSSAASVVNTIFALGQFLKINFDLDDYIRLGIESENLQHGHSSGLDVHTVYHGGALYYCQGQFKQRQLPDLPLYLIQTGYPESTTGECVSQVKPCFTAQNIGPKFATVTEAVNEAIMAGNQQQLMDAIRQNHRLLCQIGIVPQRIQAFIKQVEQQGGAAKICGAGTLRGDCAGALLVIGHSDIFELAQQHNYTVQSLQVDTRGTCVI